MTNALPAVAKRVKDTSFDGPEVALYLAITFGLCWSLAGLAIAFPAWITAAFGPVDNQSLLFYVAVRSPNIAALTLTTARGGLPALWGPLSRVVRWRAPIWVWVAALGFYPALMLVVQLVGLALGHPLPGPGMWPAVAAGLASLPLLTLGPLGEELGWRGYLLPCLLTRLSPITAALVVGAIWMVWHAPAFLLSGLPQNNMSIPVFAVGGIALSVFITWLFVNARQSILVAGIIPHAIANAWGDATGPMTWINATVLVAGAVLQVIATGPSLSAFPPSYRTNEQQKGSRS